MAPLDTPGKYLELNMERTTGHRGYILLHYVYEDAKITVKTFFRKIISAAKCIAYLSSDYARPLRYNLTAWVMVIWNFHLQLRMQKDLESNLQPKFYATNVTGISMLAMRNDAVTLPPRFPSSLQIAYFTP